MEDKNIEFKLTKESLLVMCNCVSQIKKSEDPQVWVAAMLTFATYFQMDDKSNVNNLSYQDFEQLKEKLQSINLKDVIKE